MRPGKIHVILFLLTVLTTFLTGLGMWGSYLNAALFSGALLFILGSHEMGHYFYGRKYGIDITPPYFIPAPPIISPIGTFGAFIKIKSPIYSKKALFDIGIAGPLAGIVATIPIMIAGIALSTFVNPESFNGNGGYMLGIPLIFGFVAETILGPVPEGQHIFLHPLAFAGWVGLFVTALNLIPCGQLDGGHIVYALFSKRFHKIVSLLMIAVLFVFGVGTEPLLALAEKYGGAAVAPYLANVPVFGGWPGWVLWAALLTLMGTKHPPTYYEDGGLGAGRMALGLLSLLIFVGCISPVPISLAY